MAIFLRFSFPYLREKNHKTRESSINRTVKHVCSFCNTNLTGLKMSIMPYVNLEVRRGVKTHTIYSFGSRLNHKGTKWCRYYS